MVKMCPKMPTQAKAKRDGVINTQNYNLNQCLHRKYWCSQNATNQPKSIVELGYMCPRGLTGPPAVTLTKKWKYRKRLLTLLNRLYGEWTHPCWNLFPLECTLYFPVYGLYCYFWHDCTPVSDFTCSRNIRTVKNIAYHYKHGLWFVYHNFW